MLGLMRKKLSYGLEITESQIKLVEMQLGKAKLKRAQTSTLPGGIIRGGKIVEEETLSNQIRRMFQEWGINRAEVRLSIPTTNIILRKSSFPSFKYKELRNVIDVELHGSGQLPFKSSVFDFIPIPSEYKEASLHKEAEDQVNKQEVVIFATSEEVVESYTRTVALAGMTPIAIDLVPLALFRYAVYQNKLRESGFPARFLLLYCDQEYADVAIFEKGIPVFIRSIPITAFGGVSSWSDPTENYVRTLQTDLTRILNYYQYSLSADKNEIDRMYAIGDEELTQRVVEGLQPHFPDKIEGLPLNALPFTDGSGMQQSYAVAAGLAMKGV